MNFGENTVLVTGGGSGIGLNISQQIIRKHGGTIHAFSEPNRETFFTISLPGIL